MPQLLCFQNPTELHRAEVADWLVAEEFTLGSTDVSHPGIGSYRVALSAEVTSSDDASRAYRSGLELAEMFEKLWLYVSGSPLSGNRLQVVLELLKPPKGWMTDFPDVHRGLVAQESRLRAGISIRNVAWGVAPDYPLRSLLVVYSRYQAADFSSVSLIDLHYAAVVATGDYSKEAAFARALELARALLPGHSDNEKLSALAPEVRAALTRPFSWLFELSNRRVNTRHVVDWANKPAILPAMSSDEHHDFLYNSDLLLRSVVAQRLDIPLVINSPVPPS